MKKQIIFMLVIITFMMVTPILAEEIVSNTLTIKINNNSIQILNPYRTSDNNTFIFNYSNSSILEQNFTFTDLFINNGTYKVIDLDLNSKLFDCISLTSQLNTSLTSCQIATSQLNNITSQLTVCQLDRRDRDNSLANCQKEKDALSTKVTGTSNNGIIWFLAGVGLTTLAFISYSRFKKGEGVGTKHKSEFSPLTAT